MPGLMQEQDVFVSAYREFERKLGRTEPAWLRRARESAMEHFAERGIPTTSDEEWRFTNVSPLARIPFQAAAAPDASAIPTVADLDSVLWVGSPHLVFVNGFYSEALSSSEALPQGVTVGTLSSVLGERWLEEHFARYADPRSSAFAALNTAAWQDGAYVRIAKGTVVEKPIHLLFITSSGETPILTHPRTLILAEREAQAAFIESYFGWGHGIGFSNAVTEVAVGESAVIDYYRMQVENEQSYHISRLQVYQERSASFAATSISLGARLSRNDAVAVLDGEGADCTLNGLYLGRGEQHIDNHTTIDHARPHGTSHQFYKGILDDRSAAVFNGKIVVRQDAQKTDAIQKNRNLLLSENATINTAPQLEIFADDVKCTHGATIGQIDAEALFYLRSRGIALKEARALLTYAFAADILERIRLTPIRECLDGVLHARLAASGGEEGR